MKGKRILVWTAGGSSDPALALRACAAGATGVLNLEFPAEPSVCLGALETLNRSVEAPFGVALPAGNHEIFRAVVDAGAENLSLLILSTRSDPKGLHEQVREAHHRGHEVLVEVTSAAEAGAALETHPDGFVLKGCEAGGHVGHEGVFLLIQRYLRTFGLPWWPRGGMGTYTAPACMGLGASGVCLDASVWLLPEAGLPDPARRRIRAMDGSETVLLGESLGAPFRVYARPDARGVERMRGRERAIAEDDTLCPEDKRSHWIDEVTRAVGWETPERNLLPLGQDAALAAGVAEAHPDLESYLAFLSRRAATSFRWTPAGTPLSPGAPLARIHGTRYPIVQGPMARVSDCPAFVESVSRAGALPFLALAMLTGEEVAELLAETRDRLGDSPWGVGLLGFLPESLRSAQVEAVRRCPPRFGIIAGGRPDQSAELEAMGIDTYLHVPSPGLLRLFLDQGARKFVLEGSECGGHIGPRTCFALWNAMLEILDRFLDKHPEAARETRILLAGGIHDAASAALAAAVAAPLIERGAAFGPAMGTAYLFTREAVSTGAIREGYRDQALACTRTAVLVTGPGHAVRCADSPFAEYFRATRRDLLAQGLAGAELQERLEGTFRGRAQIATRGREQTGPDPSAFVSVSPEEQAEKGLYLMGQAATLRHRISSLEELHETVSKDGSDRLRAASQALGETRVTVGERSSDVAIVGMACILPGAPDLESYWWNILRKECSIREVPPERWDWRLWYDPDTGARDRCCSRWGGFLDEVLFDPMEFGMPPNSLPSIEPLHLLTLVTVRNALKDAGYAERPYPRERTSVIIGAGGGIADLGLAYAFRSFLPFVEAYPGAPVKGAAIAEHLQGFLPEWTEDSFAGILTNVAAGRVANRLDLGGVNFTVDAACGSSLAALRLGALELQTGSSDVAIVGGADTMQSPFAFLAFSKTQALSPRGESRCLDESADGIVISEGFGVVVLKRLADAERDGDRIYAVVRAVAGSSDGKAKGMTAPRAEGQLRALRRAYEAADVSPATVELFEAHATGTAAGDQEELRALNDLLMEARTPAKRCAVGSVKSMIGHTKCTAGIASTIKMALALHHGILPPTLGVEKPHAEILSEDSPLYANTETRPWIRPANKGPRRAAVSAMGFGGTNFHAVLEEYGNAPDGRAAGFPVRQLPAELFLWGEAGPGELVEELSRLEALLGRPSPPGLGELARACWERTRRQRENGGATARLAIPAESAEDLRRKIAGARQNIAGQAATGAAPSSGVYRTDRPIWPEGKLVFLFPGQGGQYPNMLRDLAVLFREVRSAFEDADRSLSGVLPRDLSAYIYPPPSWTRAEDRAQRMDLMQTHVAQPAIGAASLGVHHLLDALGIRPDILAGHSLGELTALCAAGCFPEETFYRLGEVRGRLVQEAQGSRPGSMAAVLASPEEVRDVVKDHAGCWIVNFNSPRQTVVSGTTPALKSLIVDLESRGLTARLLSVSCAFHSPLIAPAGDRLAAYMKRLPIRPPERTVFSNTTAAPYPPAPEDLPGLLGKHLRSPVRWVDQVRAIHDAGGRIFVEVGPSTVLTSLLRQSLEGRDFLALCTDQNGKAAFPQLLCTVGQLHVHGYPVCLDRLFEGRSGHRAYADLVDAAQPEAGPSPTAWRVLGDRARPPAGTRPALPDTRRSAAPPAKADLRPAPSPNRRPPQAGPWAESPSPQRAAADDGVMGRFQSLMGKFLETQRSVMLAYLGGEPRPASAPAVLEETAAHPRPELPRTADPEPPSLAEELSQPSPSAPADDVPVDIPRAAAEPDARSTPTADLREGTRARLLELLSERTGYPEEAIELEVDLEADLGIDSIKRVEILGELRNWLGARGVQGLEDRMEALSRQKTLRGILAELPLPDSSPAVPTPATEVQPQTADADALARFPGPEPGQALSREETVKRFRFQPVSLPRNGQPVSLPLPGTLLITEDAGGIAEELCQRLRSIDQRFVRLCNGSPGRRLEEDRFEAPLDSYPDLERLVEQIRAERGPIAGIVHLLPLSPPGALDAMALDQWRGRIRQEVKSLFYLARISGREMIDLPGNQRPRILAATAMGGRFGNTNGSPPRTYFPGQAGIEGFVKTLALEWPEVNARVVDFPLELPPADVAEQLLQELGSEEGPVEIGFDGSSRLGFEPALAPLDLSSPPLPLVDETSVVLVTGGARGITFEVAHDLARAHRPRLVLLGRTPLPPAEEAPATRGLTAMAEIKAALMEQHRREGLEPRLGEVEAAFRNLLKEREVRTNLEALRSTGTTFAYMQVDVRDEVAFTRVLDGCYDRFGQIDGVIHGAGVIEDRRILDKSPASFDNVFDTKVDSAFTLARSLRPDHLRFLVFFSSVAGSFGNTGQCDYAAANEVLNKLAVYLDGAWPSRVVSINWGPWETGMVSPELRREFARRGLALIPPEVGKRRLTDELRYGRKGEGEVIITDIEGWSQPTR